MGSLMVDKTKCFSLPGIHKIHPSRKAMKLCSTPPQGRPPSPAKGLIQPRRGLSGTGPRAWRPLTPLLSLLVWQQVRQLLGLPGNGLGGIRCLLAWAAGGGGAWAGGERERRPRQPLVDGAGGARVSLAAGGGVGRAHLAWPQDQTFSFSEAV